MGNKNEVPMTRSQRIFLLLPALLLTLPLAGCYADQKKQLALCEAGAPHTDKGQPLTSIQACMDKAGYRFIAWNYGSGVQVDCDLGAVVAGAPSPLGTDAQCFQPKSWLGLKIYRIEVPVKTES
jgi:hypothetical protein